MKKPQVLLSWSTGKDAAWSLHVLRQSDQVDVVGLLTTVNQTFERVAMHAVRQELLERQAEAAGLPLIIAPLPWPCANGVYEQAITAALAEARSRFSITHIAFGDLFLEDVRAYREEQLAGTGFEPLFPLWGIPTRALAEEMVAGGLRAHLTCVDPRKLERSFAGRTFDRALLDSLPADVDPCGERGEFHTCVYDGPMFSAPLSHTVGEVVERDGFVFADLLHGECPSVVLSARAPAADSNPGEPAADFNVRELVADFNASEPVAEFDADGALTREYLLARGTCCGNRCRNCPYDWEAVPKGSAQ